MSKKNLSKSDKKVLPANNRKKPLPEPDPTLIQVARKMYEKESVGSKGKESVGSKGKKSVGSKGKKSEGIKSEVSEGTKRHK